MHGPNRSSRRNQRLSALAMRALFLYRLAFRTAAASSGCRQSASPTRGYARPLNRTARSGLECIVPCAAFCDEWAHRKTAAKFDYHLLGGADRGCVRTCIGKVCGFSPDRPACSSSRWKPPRDTALTERCTTVDRSSLQAAVVVADAAALDDPSGASLSSLQSPSWDGVVDLSVVRQRAPWEPTL